jgi:hypothetical protein
MNFWITKGEIEMGRSVGAEKVMIDERKKLEPPETMRAPVPASETIFVEQQTAEKPAVQDSAARRAVRGIRDEILALGGTPEQGEAMADAMYFVLLGDYQKARQALADGKYPHQALDSLMERLWEDLRSAA